MAISFLDNIAAARLLVLLNMPFTSWKAYELGIINQKGDTINKPSTPDQRAAWTYLHRVIRRVKALLDRVPGARIAASIYALRESGELNEEEIAILNEAIVAGETSNIFAGTNTGAVAGKGPTSMKKPSKPKDLEEFLTESFQVNSLIDELDALVSSNVKLPSKEKHKYIDRFAVLSQHSTSIRERDIDRFERLIRQL